MASSDPITIPIPSSIPGPEMNPTSPTLAPDPLSPDAFTEREQLLMLLTVNAAFKEGFDLLVLRDKSGIKISCMREEDVSETVYPCEKFIFVKHLYVINIQSRIIFYEGLPEVADEMEKDDPDSKRKCMSKMREMAKVFAETYASSVVAIYNAVVHEHPKEARGSKIIKEVSIGTFPTKGKKDQQILPFEVQFVVVYERNKRNAAKKKSQSKTKPKS